MSIIINELSSEILEQVDAELAPADQQAGEESGAPNVSLEALSWQRVMQERKARLQED